MTWSQYLTEKARDLTRRLRPDDDGETVEFADWVGDEDTGGWTPDVPSVLEEKPPRVPIIPDPPRPEEYRDQAYWDGLEASIREERGQWLSHADDLARYLQYLGEVKKRRAKFIARARREVAARQVPQVTP